VDRVLERGLGVRFSGAQHEGGHSGQYSMKIDVFKAYNVDDRVEVFASKTG